MHPLHQNKSPFPSRSGGHQRREPRLRTQWTGCKPAAPPRGDGVQGRGVSCWRSGWAKPPREPLCARIPQHLGRASAGWVLGGQTPGTKLQEAGLRRGPGARHTKRGLRPGRRGPAHKGSGARAASGPRHGPRAPGLLQLSVGMGEGAREETPRLGNVISRELQPLSFLLLPLSLSSPRPRIDFSSS